MCRSACVSRALGGEKQAAAGAVAAIGTSPHEESQWFSSRRKCRLLVPR